MRSTMYSEGKHTSKAPGLASTCTIISSLVVKYMSLTWMPVSSVNCSKTLSSM